MHYSCGRCVASDNYQCPVRVQARRRHPMRRPTGKLEAEKVTVMNTGHLVSSKLIPARSSLLATVLVVAGVLAGCSGRVAVLPNSDKALRQTPAQFAAEAAKRSYPAELPDAGKANARAQVAYEVDQIQVINLSEEDWNDVELWVNHKYVVHLPVVESGKKRVKTVTFLMLYDDQGNPFPSNNRKQFIDSLEMVRDGSKYQIPLALAD